MTEILLSGRMSFEWDYSDDTTISLIYENTQADDNRLELQDNFVSKINSMVVAHLKMARKLYGLLEVTGIGCHTFSFKTLL